jgi:hypothetical protein
VPNCPYFKSSTTTKIECKRGEVYRTFEDEDTANQLKHYCNRAYRKCWCLNALERSWGHAKTINVHQTIS